MKLNSKAIKKLIGDKVKESPNLILNCWYPEDQESIKPYLKKLENSSSWKRESKYKEDTIERIFTCKTGSDEIDEQLKAFVITDLADSQVLSIHFEG